MIQEYEDRRDRYHKADCWNSANEHCEAHFHSSLELTYVLEGQIEGRLNGQKYVLEPDMLLLVPSYSIHQYDTKTEHSRCIVLTVPLEFIPSFQKILETQDFSQVTAKLPPGHELLHCLRCLAGITRTQRYDKILVKGYVYTVIGLLVQILGLTARKKGAGLDVPRKILIYLEETYLQDITPEAAAGHFGYSRSHFLHLFSQIFGFGFAEYINLLRCRHAACLMADKNCSLIEAALGSGYHSMRTFYRNFKQVYEMTPTQYVHSHRA